MARTVKLTDYQYELVVCILETRVIDLDNIRGVKTISKLEEMIKEIDDLLMTFDKAKQS